MIASTTVVDTAQYCGGGLSVVCVYTCPYVRVYMDHEELGLERVCCVLGVGRGRARGGA